ncbi:Ankyrin repeat domain-containing protein 1 [Hondaea fermentalgiana]|uniref:Ankyrin repeat domain-containing protein 1 n=1 Tax=Hondaea fermentalgiana TaxID=2315210 RepID=A0A2R5GX53_9STRA|nr:Ankyrin repeat domain-containing protein 1 [Hondaea fermentalgiana]|eukprot:GBG32524.1 Ankyrin repeat domain-containing protein 1 [Hondaea fermentalgiana]
MASTKDWLKQVDESNNVFFYNAQTGETQWEAPEGYIDTLGKDWVEALDESGTLYYYNIITGEASWDHPAKDLVAPADADANAAADTAVTEEENLAAADDAFPVKEGDEALASAQDQADDDAPSADKQDMPEWSKVFDPSSKAYYYVNNHTLASQWDEPEGFQEVDLAKVKLLMAPEVRAAMLLQSAFRAKLARRDVRVQRAKTAASSTDEVSGWREMLDPASGFPYYFNSETNEVIWEKPADFNKVDADNSTQKKSDPISEEEERENKLVAKDQGASGAKAEIQSDIDSNDAEDSPSGEHVSATKDLGPEEVVEDASEMISNDAETSRRMIPEWVQVFDPQTKLYYFFNNHTFESQWEEPEGFERLDFSKAKHLMAPELRAALMMQCAFRSKKARQAMRAQRGLVSSSKNLNEIDGEESSGVWKKLVDPKTELPYYYNRETHETTWDPPVEEVECGEKNAKTEAGPPATNSSGDAHMPAEDTTDSVSPSVEWVEVFDPQSKRYYFFNNRTLESQWDEPEGFERIDFSKAKVLMAPELRAAIMLQCAFRAKQARQDVRIQRGKVMADENDGVLWQELHDPASGQSYFYNRETQETTWDKPRELMTESERERADEAAKAPKWYTAVDTDSGDVYFFNAETEEVSWTKPEDFDGDETLIASDQEENERLRHIRRRMALAVQGKLRKRTKEMDARMSVVRAEQAKASVVAKHRWYEVFDEEHGAYYYYDVDTRVTVWEKPADFVMEASDELLHAALLMQGLFRAKKARSDVRLLRAIELTKDEPPEKEPQWVKIFDKDANAHYWFHKRLHEISWEPPLQLTLSQGEPGSELSEMDPDESPRMEGDDQALAVTDAEIAAVDDKNSNDANTRSDTGAVEVAEAPETVSDAVDVSEDTLEAKVNKVAEEAEGAASLVAAATQGSQTTAHLAQKKTLMEKAQAQHEMDANSKEAIKKKRFEAVLKEKQAAQQERAKARAAEKAQRAADLKSWTQLYHDSVSKERARHAAEQDAILQNCLKERKIAQEKREVRRSTLAQDKATRQYANIFEAVRAGVADVSVLAPLVPETEDGLIDVRDEFGRTVLHEASWLGFSSVAKVLLTLAEKLTPGGSSSLVQAVDSCCSLTTPLHEATRAGWGGDLIRVLLAAGANISARDHLGDIPLHCAARHGHYPTIRILVEVEGGLETLLVRNYKGRTALEQAEMRNDGLLPKRIEELPAARTKRRLGIETAPAEEPASTELESGEVFVFDGDFSQTVDILRTFHNAAIEQFGPELKAKRKLQNRHGSLGSPSQARKSKLQRDNFSIRNMFPQGASTSKK